MTWREDFDRLVEARRRPNPQHYRMRPDRDGVLVRCETCAKDVAGPYERFGDLVEEVLTHDDEMHQR